MRTTLGLTLLLICCLASAAEKAHTVLVEAEAFAEQGGWVVDQQFMDQMGSPFLLAHGLGVPVADATHDGRVARAGDVSRLGAHPRLGRPVEGARAPGQVPGARRTASRWQTTFGTEGAAWHWQDGGTVELAGDNGELALHDLTGFDGRCDAILLTHAIRGFAPPDARPRRWLAFARKLLGLPERAATTPGQFDLVVVGGGMAGTCAAVSAARLGLDVALIQDRPVLGGNNSSEVRVHLGGGIHQPPYPALGRRGGARLGSGKQRQRPARRQLRRREEARGRRRPRRTLTLFLNTHAHQGRKERQAHHGRDRAGISRPAGSCALPAAVRRLHGRRHPRLSGRGRLPQRPRKPRRDRRGARPPRRPTA